MGYCARVPLPNNVTISILFSVLINNTIGIFSAFFTLQITLKKFSLTALPSGSTYGVCIEEPNPQYVQGDTVIARHGLILNSSSLLSKSGQRLR